MPRITDVAIVALPVAVCLALFWGQGLLRSPTDLEAVPVTALSANTAASRALPAPEQLTQQATVQPSETAGGQVAALPESAAEQLVVTAPSAAPPSPQAVQTPASRSPAPQAQPAETPAPTDPAPAALSRGRELAGLLYTQQLTTLWNAFSPAVRQEWGSFERFQTYRAGGLRLYGAETGVLSETVRGSGGVTYYTRTSAFERGTQEGWTLVLGLTPEGQVAAFAIVGAGVLPTDTDTGSAP